MHFRSMSQINDVRNDLTTHPSRQYDTHSIEQISMITVHHSATSTGNAASFANYHVNHHGWPGIGYHFVILRNGEIEWAQSIGTTSYHTGGRNTGNIGICLVGSGQFTSVQMSRLKDLIIELRKDVNVPIHRVLGHSEHPNQSTACPGFNVAKLREELESIEGGQGGDRTVNLPSRTLRNGDSSSEVSLLQQALIDAGESLPQFGVDGQFGAETERAVRNFQKRHNLVVDGIAGPKTYQRLREVLTKKSDKIHKVQVGAFTHRENAEKLAKELRDTGYDIYIITE
ncbi:N-acetylmuramoyl-L-alanine amidase [Bacillus shivajii]|uniref:N-acetylmuramoyl-L-alanine amidase n=1 Tax=Bacillus shivajii TaxID=1983719 RepID=UPI001CF9EFA7|nr:N-acetylmuramoyl-L-alanine amidase [Bacillus shivajii]UCZ54159.1 N-acetylmuramoyl-L-alanine amidase [Bacillus shivajii]